MSADEHRHAIDRAHISAGLVIAPSALQMLRVLRFSELLPRLPRLALPLTRGP
ncbi:hypothetical protein WME99_00075 [Sorangium sp. So ce136]|uniref:hypothetical protein n=1 Tax=Sorangium sp. So ce136 TaxID=3133284 RepID=UPI003F0FA10A